MLISARRFLLFSIFTSTAMGQQYLFSIFSKQYLFSIFSKPALLELPPRKLFLFPMGHGHPILEMLSTTSPQHLFDFEKTHLVVICHKNQGFLNSLLINFAKYLELWFLEVRLKHWNAFIYYSCRSGSVDMPL